MPDPDGASQESAGSRLARWLRALAREVERDPALAARVTEATAPAAPPDPQPPVPSPAARHAHRSSRFGPPTIAGRAPELGTGVPDPFAVRAASGEDGLRRALMTLRAGSLRAIVRVHDLDPHGKLGPHATEQRLIDAIVAATRQGAARRDPKGTAVQPKKKSEASATRGRPRES
jgi:hypothetical protein